MTKKTPKWRPPTIKGVTLKPWPGRVDPHTVEWPRGFCLECHRATHEEDSFVYSVELGNSTLGKVALHDECVRKMRKNAEP